jgi:hypothetical protein
LSITSAFQLPQNQDWLFLKLHNDNDDTVKDSTNQYVSKQYETISSGSFPRRSFFTAVISCVGCVSADHLGFWNDNSVVANAAVEAVRTTAGQNGIIRSKGCYQGTGDGCTELSENNALIQQLQQQSIANRERNEKEALYAYYMKNYPDFFNSIGQVLVKKSSDNTFVLMTPQEVERLKGLGKLTYETPKTRGGTIVDYTQKPILVLKE